MLIPLFVISQSNREKHTHSCFLNCCHPRAPLLHYKLSWHTCPPRASARTPCLVLHIPGDRGKMKVATKVKFVVYPCFTTCCGVLSPQLTRMPCTSDVRAGGSSILTGGLVLLGRAVLATPFNPILKYILKKKRNVVTEMELSISIVNCKVVQKLKYSRAKGWLDLWRHEVFAGA